MNTTIMAALISEGSKLISMWLRNRPVDVTPIELSPLPPPRKMTITYLPEEEKKDQQSTTNNQVKAIPQVTAQEIAMKLAEPDSSEDSITEGGFVTFNPKVAENVASLESNVKMLPEGKATAIATGCIPCAIGHIGTCSGVINEAVRFARSEGLVNDDVINRVGMCLDELNSMERVDLRPEMLQQLSPWERELAQKVLVASRKMRHSLEAMEDVDSLEKVAAETQSTRQEVWRDWIKQKMNSLTPSEQAMVETKLRAKLAELAAKEETEEIEDSSEVEEETE